MSEFDELVERLTRETPLSREQARDHAQRLGVQPLTKPIVDEMTRKPETIEAEVFMTSHGLNRNDLRELLREYRSECGWGAFELGERDVLGSDFLNWYDWERLG